MFWKTLSFSKSIFFANKHHQLEDQSYLEIVFACFLTHFQKKVDPDVIWTRNLLIWSQTRYRCATESISGCQLVQFRADKRYAHSEWNSQPAICHGDKSSVFSTHVLFAPGRQVSGLIKVVQCFEPHRFDPDVIWTRNLLIWSQTCYCCATESKN